MTKRSSSFPRTFVLHLCLLLVIIVYSTVLAHYILDILKLLTNNSLKHYIIVIFFFLLGVLIGFQSLISNHLWSSQLNVNMTRIRYASYLTLLLISVTFAITLLNNSGTVQYFLILTAISAIYVGYRLIRSFAHTHR